MTDTLKKYLPWLVLVAAVLAIAYFIPWGFVGFLAVVGVAVYFYIKKAGSVSLALANFRALVAKARAAAGI